MTALLFPDNTVLVNFGLMGRVDLFARIVRDNGAWTLTVSEECERSAQVPGHESLVEFRALLGDPMIPALAERIDTGLLRAQLAQPGDAPTRHLGEAEAIAIISHRGLSAAFVTDDVGARRLALANGGIRTYSTTDLLKLAVRAKLTSEDGAWALVELLRAHGRMVGNVPRTFVKFQNWCER